MVALIFGLCACDQIGQLLVPAPPIEEIETDLDTILGEFSFNADGDAVYDPIVLIVENGKLKVFE